MKDRVIRYRPGLDAEPADRTDWDRLRHMTDEEIENGTWEDNEDRQRKLDECDEQYYKHPDNYIESLLAFVKANRTKIKL